MLRNSTEKRIQFPTLFSPTDLSNHDQRTISLRAQLRLSYETYAWLRYLTWTGMALLGAMLLILPGFPPRAFLSFWQMLPLAGRLLAQHGSAAFFSLLTLGVQALTWLVLWGLWLASTHALARYTWRLASTRKLLGTGWLPSSALGNALKDVDKPQDAGEQHPSSRDTTILPSQPNLVHSTRVSAAKSPLRAPLSAPVAPQMNAQQQTRQFLPPTLPSTRPRAQSLAGETLAGWPGGLTISGPGVAWDVGITRKGRPNEDSVLTMRGTCTGEAGLLPFELHIVADGMGGHAHGRLASHLALRGMAETVVPGLIACQTLENEGIIDILIDGVHWANQIIYQHSREQGADMGTTITAALLLNKTAYIINVGDSRTYVYRPRAGLTQITRDHSLVARLVENGSIAPDEIYTHPDRNKVYRGLGDKTEVTVDWFVLPVQSGDLLLLCSDGLWEMVRDPQMAEILTMYAASPTLASHALLRAALQAGGNDNVSLLVVGI
jgi:serine/threonine protein phosphatase PrpC